MAEKSNTSYLNPRVIFNETKRPFGVEADWIPTHTLERQSPITRTRERAHRLIIHAGALITGGVASLAAAESIPDFAHSPVAQGVGIGVYALASMTGSMKYLLSADCVQTMRELVDREESVQAANADLLIEDGVAEPSFTLDVPPETPLEPEGDA
jgi:hypothetical protein